MGIGHVEMLDCKCRTSTDTHVSFVNVSRRQGGFLNLNRKELL